MESLSNLTFTGFNAHAFLRANAGAAEPHDAVNSNENPGLDVADFGRRTDRHHHPVRQRELPLAATESAPSRASPAAQPAADAQSSAALSYGRSERTSLFITTQEGDTVELKIKTREAAALDASASGDQLLTELKLNTQSTTSIAFTVNGNLSADELTAIRGVIEQAGALAQQFFDGQLPNAFAAAQSFHIDATQLANVGLRMSFREQLTYSQIGPSRPAVAPPPSIAATPALPVATVPTTLDPAATPVASTEPVSASAMTTNENSALPAANSEIKVSPQHMVQALDLIRGFLSQLMDKFATPAASGTGANAPSLELSLKLKIFQSMVTTAAANAPPDAGAGTALPALVPDTLDALAARQDPPLHAVA